MIWGEHLSSNTHMTFCGISIGAVNKCIKKMDYPINIEHPMTAQVIPLGSPSYLDV